MSFINYYKLLNLPDFAEVQEVKSAFRKLALQLHPDRNKDPQAAIEFKKVLEAYECLGDVSKKSIYDQRLKLGFPFDFKSIAPDFDELAEKKKRYAAMRKERDDLQEVVNITHYENSLRQLAFGWRVLLLVLLQITGIFYVVSDWYQKGIKITLGMMLFFFTSLVLWNELYKHFWHKSITSVEKRYDRQAYSRFLGLFFGGILLMFCLILVKKHWHLHNFGKVIYANVHPQQKMITYQFNDAEFNEKVFQLPDDLKVTHQVLIKISTKEPEIWEYYSQ